VKDVSSVLDLPRSLKPGEYAWQDTEVAAGPLRIFVDLETALVHVLRGNVEIGRAAIIFGSDNKPTPTGIFRISQKNKDHVSNIYNVPMPYMLRLTWDGIAIHATDIRGRSSTHGCIGLPEEFAALLFQEAELGTQVLVTRVVLSDEHLRVNGGLHGLMGLLSMREIT
jgi:lipoprotein-anchoring transpeptidase ErfK/SrfK